MLLSIPLFYHKTPFNARSSLFTNFEKGGIINARIYKGEFMVVIKFYEEVDPSLLKYSVIVAKHEGKTVLCKHKERDTYELPGGHIEQGENSESAAFRELFEETSITRKDIKLHRLMDFSYPFDDCYVEVYAGRLNKDVQVSGDENDLYWSTLECDFFDMSKYAGEGNIGHILVHINYNKDVILKIQ